MANPGWYPDPDDGGWLQYFDGQRWTGERYPAEPPAPPAPAAPFEPPAAPPAPFEPPPGPPGPPGPPAPAAPFAPPVPPEPAAPDAPSDADLTMPRPAQPERAPAEPAPYGYPAAEPAPYGYPAAEPAPYGYPAPTAPLPEQAPQGYVTPAASYPPHPPWAQPGWAPEPTRRRKRVPLIIGLALVVAAGLATGGYFLFSSDKSPTFTFDGKAIDQPDQALARAGSTLRSLVTSRHGAQDKDTRCYYAVPDQPAQGAEKTDVDHAAWCGPVLFVDGAPDKQYLRFALSSADAGEGKVTLTPSGLPATDDPGSVPAELTLERPDGATAPPGVGGLAVPAPPPAAKDALVAADLGKQTVPGAPPTAVMGSLDGGVEVVELGPVTRYGFGDDARSAPDGGRLIAFQLAGAEGDNGDVNDLSGSTEVTINGGKARKLPSAEDGEHIVLAVPKAARSVQLVLDRGGYRQTISLLDGKPGKRNITVLARSHRTVTLHKSGRISFGYSQTVVFDDGSTGRTEAGTYSTTHAGLYFALPDKHAKASGPGKALLYVDIGYKVAHSPGKDFGFPAKTVTFTPSGKSPIRARNVATTKDHIYNIFEVPGTLTSGVLTVSGSYRSKFANTGDAYTTTIKKPIRVRITFPAH